MVLSGDTEIVSHGSHYWVIWVIAAVQRDPKDKDSEFESFVFCVFWHDSKDSKELVCTRL